MKPPKKFRGEPAQKGPQEEIGNQNLSCIELYRKTEEGNLRLFTRVKFNQFRRGTRVGRKYFPNTAK
jgi:hypothetical protein